MKRKITIVLTIFFAILAICNFSNATSEITEDRLIEALNEVSGYKKTATTDDGRERTISYEGLTCEIDNEKNIITLKMEDLDKTEVKYDLTNTKEPTFEYVLKYKKTMNYDEFGEEFARGELMQNALVTIASRTQGILIEDAGTYSIEKTFSESRINKLIEASMNFSNAINESKKIYDDTYNINDELYNVSYKITNETDEECDVKVTIQIMENSDFTKMNNYFLEKLDVFEILMGKLFEALQGIPGNTPNQNNIISTENRIPKTGNKIDFVKTLKTLIIICISLGTIIYIYNRKRSL